MSKTVSVRVEHRAATRATGQRNHDLRHGKQIPKYVNKEKIEENSIIIEPKTAPELRKLCEERRAQRPTKRAMKKDAAIATNGIITFGTEAQPIIENLSKDDQNRLFHETAKRIADRLNTDLTGLVVHRDESAIHAHFQLLAVNRDGMPLSKTINRQTAKELQDIAGQVYAAHGITRGTPKAERLARGDDLSKIVHRSVTELHRDLPTEISNKQRELDEKRKALEAQRRELEELEAKAEKNRRLIAEQNAKLEAGRVTEELAKKRIETYKKREADAKAKAEKLAKEIAEKESALKLIDKPQPPLPKPEIVTIRDGILKSHDEFIYTSRDVKKFAKDIEEWAKDAATKSIRQKTQNIELREQTLERKETQMVQRESEIAKREQSITSREKYMNTLETENKRLKDERSIIGTHLGHMLGVENASMNRGKIVDAIVKTGDITKFREILRENRVLMKGQGKGIGA
jgi:septal ring factor EnvC (AmiA/AmiB activator)